MTLSDYSKLKDQVRLSVGTSDSHGKLQTLKELFRDGINSVRRFEQINKIGELLQILELRNLLSENNVGPLKDIAREIKSKDLLYKIIDYEESHEPRQYVNYYVSEKATKSASSECFNNTREYEGNLGKKKKERIFLTVTEEIGSSWRDLARSLRIQECKIDEIDNNNKTMATKAFKMLELFYSRADCQKWHFILCDALDQIRRKKLRHSVQEIMMMNI